MKIKNISIEVKSLILAIFIHIIIAELFVFSFPIQHIANKPVFVFWGSFLDPINKTTSAKSHIKTSTINVKPHQSTRRIFEPQNIKKPSAISNKKNEEKNFIKTTFLTNNNNTYQSKHAVKYHAKISSMLNSTKAAYTPLKPKTLNP